MEPSIRIVTLNVRHNADRWPERARLLVDQMAELSPDVAGLQEIHVPSRQGKWLVEQLNARRAPGVPPYELYQANKTGFYGYLEGVGIITRLPEISYASLDLLGGHRIAQRLRVRAPSGAALDVYNTHLHHEAHAGAMRLAQAELILDWIGRHGDAPAVLVGDLNATPDAPPVRRIAERMRSAYALVHGREPDGTVPTPLDPTWGRPPKVIDYIFVDGRVAVVDAWVCFDRVSARDPRLAASDHYGLAADVTV